MHGVSRHIGAAWPEAWKTGEQVFPNINPPRRPYALRRCGEFSICILLEGI